MIPEQLTLESYANNGPGYKAEGTSRDAAVAVASTTEAARAKILALLWTTSALTADEIASRMDWSILYTRPRVSELHKMGAIKKAGRRRNESGLNANTWAIA